MQNKPNLFLVGAMKSATTSLHNYLDIHFMMVLPNSLIAESEYIKKYEIVTTKTQPRFSHRHISGQLSTDTVNFLTQSSSFTEEEWLEGYLFRWSIIFGHYLGPLQFIARGLNIIYNVAYKDFYVMLLSFSKGDTNSFIGREYKQVLSDARKILTNQRHWGEVIDDVSDINWDVDEAMCIKIASNRNKFYEEIAVR